jgi:hypothetical protein
VTVILDPAHGGADFGARGPTGLAESDVVLDFARAARIALEAQRLRVLLTREGNQDPSFDNRSAMVNGLHNTVFISLHSLQADRWAWRDVLLPLPSVATGGSSTGIGVVATTIGGIGRAQGPRASSSHGMIVGDRAALATLSRQLAELAQAELAGRFKGSGYAVAAPASVAHHRFADCD